MLPAAFRPKKRRPSEGTPSESRPRTVPQDRCRLLSSGPALAGLWFGPLYAPATRPFSFSLFLPAAPCRRMHLESSPFSEKAAPPSGGPARSPRSTCKDTHNPRICNARSPVFARAKGCFWPSLWMYRQRGTRNVECGTENSKRQTTMTKSRRLYFARRSNRRAAKSGSREVGIVVCSLPVDVRLWTLDAVPSSLLRRPGSSGPCGWRTSSVPICCRD